MSDRLSLSKVVTVSLRLRTEQRGGVAVMMGLLFPVLLAGLGLGFEISSWYLRSRAMQNAADAAVMAAASNGEDNFNVEAAAVAAHYGYVDGASNVSVAASNDAPCPEGADVTSSCYSVSISSIVPLYLSQLLGFAGDLKSNGVAQKLLTSAAVAVQTTIQQPLCLLTLSKSGTGLRTNGAPNSDFNGCTVMSNSKASCNGSDLKANYGLAADSNDGCGVKKKSNIKAVDDPYAKLAINIPADTCGTGENAYPQEPKKPHDPPLPATNTWSGTQSISGVKQMCGDVQLTAHDLTVRVCADDERGSYCFRCPDCQGAVAKEASRRIVDLLVSSGVRMQVWRLPAELTETRVGEPLTPDDLLDFHLLLTGDDWFEELAVEVRRSLNS